jgi:enoyl-CoA hydratase
LLGRLAGREAAAALGLFDEVVDGAEASRRGLAWLSVPTREVDAKAIELAKRVANVPELSRAAVASLRIELGPPPIPWGCSPRGGKGPANVVATSVC